MKKELLLTGVALLSVHALQAQDLIHDGIAYNFLNGEELEVTALPDNEKYSNEVHVPFNVIIGDWGPVVGASDGTQGNEDGETPIVYQVVKVADGAFKDCTHLTKLELPYSLEEIGNEAVAGCTSLIEITMPRNLRRIGDRAFEGSSVGSLTITDGLEEIGDRVFYHTIANYIILEGCDLTELGSETFTGSTVERILLPKGLKSIPEDTFRGCNHLAYIGFNSSLEEIGTNAFSGCGSLSALTLPGSLKEIGVGAFSGVQLRSISFNSMETPAYTMESVCGDNIPSLAALPAGSEQSYREWCPALFEGKASLYIGGEFGSTVSKWIYPGVVDPEQIVNQIPLGVSVCGTIGETLVLAAEGSSVSVCCPLLMGDGYDFEINGEKRPFEIIFSELDSFYWQYLPTAEIGDSSFVTLENVTGSYTVNLVYDNIVGIRDTATDIPYDSTVTLYNLNGIPMGSSTEDLPSGIYIKKHGSNIEKIVVR
ncbi:MAG: leucine-rich repeat domain-containing protein [Bacteroides sp.]|nr:leucine-rich repeat domain-containing protein [Bacteroides sp.]